MEYSKQQAGYYQPVEYMVFPILLMRLCSATNIQQSYKTGKLPVNRKIVPINL